MKSFLSDDVCPLKDKQGCDETVCQLWRDGHCILKGAAK